MFYGNYYFNNDISNWELDSIENLSGIFADSKFNVNIGKWKKYIKPETNTRDMFTYNHGYSFDKKKIFSNNMK